MLFSLLAICPTKQLLELPYVYLAISDLVLICILLLQQRDIHRFYDYIGIGNISLLHLIVLYIQFNQQQVAVFLI